MRCGKTCRKSHSGRLLLHSDLVLFAAHLCRSSRSNKGQDEQDEQDVDLNRVEQQAFVSVDLVHSSYSFIEIEVVP